MITTSNKNLDGFLSKRVFCKDTLSIFTFSDVHLGHRKTPSVSTINSLELQLKELKEKNKVPDLIIVAGDLFDRLLNLSVTDVNEIILFLHYLVRWCIKNKVFLRVLEGTPSHDWKQSELIETICKSHGEDLPEGLVRWVSEIEIEYLKPLDITILSIPDEISATNDITKEIVKNKLKEAKLKTVSVINMHGAFEYQLPEIVKNVHDSKFYNSITDYVCYCGHVHLRSTNGKIEVPGSTNRLAHGEESPKGTIYTVVQRATCKKTTTFIPIIKSAFYKSIDLTYLDIEQAVDNLEKLIASIKKELKKRMYTREEIFVSIRIICLATDVAASIDSQFKKKYREIEFLTDISDKKNVKKTAQELTTMDIELKPLNKNTLPELVEERLKTMKLDEETLKLSMSFLDEIMRTGV